MKHVTVACAGSSHRFGIVEICAFFGTLLETKPTHLMEISAKEYHWQRENSLHFGADSSHGSD